MRTIASMNKAELIAALKELGEEPPTQCKVIDLQVRLVAKEEEMGISALRTKETTELKTWTTRLNQALRKKSNAQEFIRTELNLTLTGNETLMDLQRKGLNKIYQMTTPSGQDPVGFGEHSDLTYAELKVTQPRYCAWVIKTMQENPEHGLRLGRLGKWLKMDPEKMKTSTQPIYMTQPKKEKESASSVKIEVATGSHELMTKMAAQVQALAEEVHELRQERPQKKVEVKADTNDETMNGH